MSIASKLRHLVRVLTNPRWWSFYLQRRVLDHTTRNQLVRIIAAFLRPKPGQSHVMRLKVEDKISEMRDSGIVHLGQLLSPSQAKELYDYFSQKLVEDPYRFSDGAFTPDSDQRNPSSHIAHHSAADIIRAPFLLSLINRPDILAVVEGLMGCKPTLGYVAAWWSYKTDVGAQEAENFHRDVDDFRFFKLFIYLSDVDFNNGPHVYVSKSSSSSSLLQIRRFSDEEVTASFGSDRIIKITGSSGVGFLEDTFGLHKGQPLVEGKRLIFQAVYSMFPLPYGPVRPVISFKELPFADRDSLDPWTNRVYVSAH